MPHVALPHERVLTRLGPSAIHGVGVFALVSIAEGTVLFVHDEAEIRWIDANAVEQAAPNPGELAFYRDFAIRKDGRLGCPQSFDLLTPGWYVNRPEAGEMGNVRATEDFRLIAARDIQSFYASPKQQVARQRERQVDGGDVWPDDLKGQTELPRKRQRIESFVRIAARGGKANQHGVARR